MLVQILRLLIMVILALGIGKLVSKLKLPSILGWLITGMVFGPHAFAVMNQETLLYWDMLCLVGGQGAGKSSFFRLLAVNDDWFSDDLKKLDDENVYRKMQGHWIIEMSEMIATANAKSIEEMILRTSALLRRYGHLKSYHLRNNRTVSSSNYLLCILS